MSSKGATHKNHPKPKMAVLEDIKRDTYDLSHWSFMVGAIGSLQTLACVPIVAGDSIDLNASIVFRLSPLRRNLYLDSVVDLFAFYVPHRHIYNSNSAGSRWEDFILAGIDEGVTLGTDALAGGTNMESLGLRTGAGLTCPRWLTRGYVQIWNRYFRDPSDVAGLLSESYFTGSPTSNEMNFGLACCHLPDMVTAPLKPTTTTADYRLPLEASEVNLYSFKALQGRLASELARDWYGLRYTDLLNYSWSSEVNTDADQRPTLLMRSTQWLSGFDVDSHESATLGTYSGKAQAICNLRVPHRFLPEHGALWIMALVRLPYVNTFQTHFLVNKAEPTYLQISGDPDAVARQGQYSLDLNEILQGNSSVAIGDVGYAQWYRTHPSQVHNFYRAIEGHPFLDEQPTTRNGAIYISPTVYDDIFATLQLKHWNSQGHIGLHVKRFVPDVNQSIFSAVR